MRNLQQTHHKRYPLEGVCCSCYRQEKPIAARIVNGNALIEQLEPEKSILASFEVPPISQYQHDWIVDLHHVEEDDSLCLIMHGGDIISVQLNDANEDNAVEIIGSLDQVIMAAQWSPDEEVIALATSDKLNLLTREFLTLAEIPFTEDDLKINASVSVGWGRSETQFRGKNVPRDPTLPVTIDKGVLSEDEDGQIRLSWRGDAQFLSLSSCQQNRRVIRVYSRDGALDSISEPVDGQEGCLSWKPSGSLITTVQTVANGSRKCIMFERNGLRHGEFDLPGSEQVKSVSWNCDGTVLAVRTTHNVDFWTASNYHYSLKSRISSVKTVDVTWHPEKPLKILLLSSDEVFGVTFRWKVTSQEPVPPGDFGLVGIVDADRLGLTPIRLANVPPPMSYRTLQLLDVPQDVAISADSKFLAILYMNSLQIYGWDLSTYPKSTPKLVATIGLTRDVTAVPLQATIDCHSKVHILLSSHEILEITGSRIAKLAHPLTSTYIIQCFEDGLLAQTEDAALIVYHSSVPEFHANTYCCNILAARRIDDQVVLFGLTDTGSLYAGGSQVAQKVTSFLIVKDLLLYTTATFLKFMHLQQDLNDILDDVTDERCRRIERGSTLICSSPTAQSITLQAPRGNLETIYPRILVLSAIREAISSGFWSDAWRKVKIHRVDTNIMCDHNPNIFLNNLKAFVEGLQTSTELDLFLINLKGEDVTRTMYENTSLSSKSIVLASQTPGDKVNDICRRLLDVLQAHFAQTHLSSTLTAYLSMAPPNYHDALQRISSLTGDELDAAITHICFLEDPQHLYNEALGLYDLPLALLLIQRSQKDPREYVPFLQSIQRMSVIRQHFSLDDHLQRYEKALESLLQIDEAWDETCLYIQRHILWRTALKLLRHDHHRNVEITKLYAEYLFDCQQFADAAYAFEYVGNYPRAAASFEEAILWQDALHCAFLAEMDIQVIATRIALQLVDQSRYADAALLYEQHLHDIDSAIVWYCKAFNFNRAILLANTEVRKKVRPRLTETFVQLSELFSDMKSQLNDQLPRLKRVREHRAENPDLYLDGEPEDDAPDNVSLSGSVATTSASGLTRYTSASALSTQSKKSGRSRRRQERQRAKGKKGTIWEEEYLVNSFRRLVDRLQSTLHDAKCLIIALVRCDLKENASVLQNSVTSLIDLVRDNVEVVFSGITTLPEALQRSMGSKPSIERFEPFGLC